MGESGEPSKAPKPRDVADEPVACPDGRRVPAEAGQWLEGLASDFEEMARSLFKADTLAGVLGHIVDATCAVVPGADLVSVTLTTREGHHITPAQTDQLACNLDQLQYSLGEGPSLDATHASGTGHASSNELGAGREWPNFGPAAADKGVHSVLSTGLFPNESPPRLGALNCYSLEVHGLDAADQNIAVLLAAHAATAVSSVQARTDAELETSHLRRALESRDVIGQAKGILMQRRNITAERAFDILRKASQDLNIKLTSLARSLTSNRDKL